ncbi:YncE family protein [Aquimarina agarilytica]|uniref:YncE family protein n=1 Tax=Aquimarina agarilytica TaxID=1087449 RepID=UPI0002892B36|nr:DUF5074 domain-containing protein [Aquimarina agarilytica]
MKSIFKMLLISVLIISCSGDDTNIIEKTKEIEVIKEIEVTPDTKFDGGFFVSAEGNFGMKDGSISYVTNDLSTTTNFIYNKVNGVQLGGLIQSITYNGDNAYVILNDAATLVIIDRVTFKRKAVVTSGLKNPRYMAVIGTKGYITNWGEGADENDDYVAILDLTTNKLETNTISLANGVEQIVSKDDKLFVSHKGAFSSNNIVSVIDTSSNNSVSTITVKDNPDDMLFTEDGSLVVLSEGRGTAFGGAPFFEVLERTTSAISFIDTDTNEIKKQWVFDENKGSALLAYTKGNLYYVLGTDVIEIDAEATDLSASKEGIAVGNVYGMNAKEDKLYTVSAAFTIFSELKIFDIPSKSAIFSSSVGLGASKIYFE